jgi:hypothetical protein
MLAFKSMVPQRNLARVFHCTYKVTYHETEHSHFRIHGDYPLTLSVLLAEDSDNIEKLVVELWTDLLY